MYQLLMGLYILICFLLVAVILMQTGRGGGLVESASAAEAIFGGKTNIYMVKITMVIGAMFLALALGLNYYAVQRNKSIIEKLNASAKKGHQSKPALPLTKPNLAENSAANVIPIVHEGDAKSVVDADKKDEVHERISNNLSQAVNSAATNQTKPITVQRAINEPTVN